MRSRSIDFQSADGWTSTVAMADVIKVRRSQVLQIHRRHGLSSRRRLYRRVSLARRDFRADVAPPPHARPDYIDGGTGRHQGSEELAFSSLGRQ